MALNKSAANDDGNEKPRFTSLKRSNYRSKEQR